MIRKIYYGYMLLKYNRLLNKYFNFIGNYNYSEASKLKREINDLVSKIDKIFPDNNISMVL